MEALDELLRSGALSRRQLFRRAAVLLGSAAAFELLGKFPCAFAATPSPGITLDPTIDPLLQGYLTDGTVPYTPGQRLLINDTSGADHRTFYITAPAIATSAVSVDVTVQLVDPSVIPINTDTGVRAILSEGAGGLEIAAALRDLGNGDRRIAFALANGAFTAGVPFDWSIEQTFRLERNPDPARRAVIIVPGQPEQVLTDADLPAARRANPGFEFGTVSYPPTATALFGPIGLPTEAPFASFLVRILRVRDFDCRNGFALEIDFALPPGVTLNAATDPVSLKLTRAAAPASFWPANALMPVTGFDLFRVFGRDVYSLRQAERTRTGIEAMAITPYTHFGCLDANAGLPGGDYSQVTVELRIGQAVGRQTVQMVQMPAGSGRWRLA